MRSHLIGLLAVIAVLTLGLFVLSESRPVSAQSADPAAGADTGADTGENTGETIGENIPDLDSIAPTGFVIPEGGPFNSEEIAIRNNEAIMDWFRSAHADSAAEAFRHWDEEQEIAGVCAVCHAGEGFRAYHGLDGGTPGIPQDPIDVGGVVDCATCHNPGLGAISEVSLPSGISHPVEGVEVACMTCHVGRTAGVTVEAAIADLPEDTPDADLRFINPHYATAGATWLGGYGGAGFHYDGRDYVGRFFHAGPIGTCVSCHEPHTLEVAETPCSTCHENSTFDEIRITRQSYDGSGNLSVGISSDIAANADLLIGLTTRYAAEVVQVPMIYDGASYPYFFTDANGDGAIDTADGRNVAYQSWTPRMLRAAYNWKLVTADPGAYVHNPYYALQLLYDAVEDLSGPLGIDMDALGIVR